MLKPNETANAQGVIEWNREKLHRFKVAYNWAVAQHNKEFTWDGYEFVTDYAKYLIMYLEGELGTKPIK